MKTETSVPLEPPVVRARQRARRPVTALAWSGGFAALFALYLRISYSGHVTSDAANNALQAWDMLHGNPRLHGWIIGDATYYTLELPLFAIIEVFFGLRDLIGHLLPAVTYLIVTACALALAVKDSRGLARMARAGVTVVVATAMFHVGWTPSYLVGAPDHTGTSAFLLVSFLLIDRAYDRRFTAPVLLVILTAGQIGDATVSFVAVPAIILVCGYRVVTARKVRTGDGANALAAALSVPLALAVRAVMLRFGAYQMAAPHTAISGPGQWPHNAALAWSAIRVLFGLEAGSGGSLARVAGYALALACLVAAAAGLARVAWTWQTASRAEQLLYLAIVVNIVAYMVSTIPSPTNPYEIVAVLPCGAVLAARACVPGHFASTPRAAAAAILATVVALVPMAAAAARPPVPVPTAALSGWLEAHGLRYGLAGYWDSSVVTLHTGNRVQVRPVTVKDGVITQYHWEVDGDWYDPSRHDATFVVIDIKSNDLGGAAELDFGKPAAIHSVGHYAIWTYHENLLDHVAAASPEASLPLSQNPEGAEAGVPAGYIAR
jgi:hypothetical protein